MRVAINLLTDDPANPSGAHWFWTRIIPEMAKLLTEDEEFRLLVSPKSRPMHEGYGPTVATSPFRGRTRARSMRTLSEHLYAPVRLPSVQDRRLQHADRADRPAGTRPGRAHQDHARVHRAAGAEAGQRGSTVG